MWKMFKKKKKKKKEEEIMQTRLINQFVIYVTCVDHEEFG